MTKVTRAATATGKRSYRQACALSLALDLIGERWTLLIIRALLTGPKRYGELAAQLPAMGTNLLADRLKQLVGSGIAERSQDANQPAGYCLSSLGEALRPVVHELIRWGQNWRGLQQDDFVSDPLWDMLALEAAFQPERWDGQAWALQMELAGFEFWIDIQQGQARCHVGQADQPDARIESSGATLLQINAGELTRTAAEKRGDLRIRGSRQAARVLFDAFAL